MDFLKLNKFRKAHRLNPQKDPHNNDDHVPVPVPLPQEANKDPHPHPDELELGKSVSVNANADADEDDDDFIMTEVKRRLKQLRRNSFMVLIPEEENNDNDDEEEEQEEQEEEEEGETSSSEWRDVEAEGRQLWSGFGALYDKYCERMLYFDRLITLHLKQNGSASCIPSTPSPRSVSKKLTSPLGCLSLKKTQEPEDDALHLQQPENGHDPYLDLETAYVAQLCLTWETLHCQYTQLTQKISCQSENSLCYNHSAQLFQQFQVLLQRFIENEPFERGLRPDIYARTRVSLSKLLQVPNILGSDRKEMTGEESDMLMLAPDLITAIESSILTFKLFLKMDKKKSNGVRDLFGGQNQMATPLQQVQSTLDKKEMKLKEQWKKRKGGKRKRNGWPVREEEVELLLGLIDMKVISRVLRMGRISKEELFWSEEKMKKLDLSTGKLQRDPSPILFPLVI